MAGGDESPGDRDLDSYARHYRELPFEAVAASVRRRLVLERVARWSPRRLMEVGCGLAPLFTDLVDVQVLVVEPAEDFSALAHRLARDRSGVEVRRALVEDLVPGDLGGDFDMVVVSGLLHEVADPRAVLVRASQCCGPTGVVHINVPNATSLHRRLGVAMGLLEDLHDVSATGRALEQHRVFDVGALESLVVDCGLEVVERGGVLVKPFSHQQMEAALRSGVLDEAAIEGLARWAEREPGLASEIWVDARKSGG